MSRKIFVQIDVLANARDGRLFTYSVDDDIKIGQIVVVEFGRRRSLGIVSQVSFGDPKIAGIKPVAKILDHIPTLPSYLLATAEWLKTYYGASSYTVWTTILPSGVRAKSRQEFKPEKLDKPAKLNTLSREQSDVFLEINVGSKKPHLIMGVTGSGKTEIYLHLIARSIESKHSSILLVPEIMLTTQLADRLKQHFSNVIIIHSGLSTTERRRIWEYCLKYSNKQALVIVGPRSALWMPIHNLGLIIIDEEHEPSYKQESFLRYSSVHVAGFIAKLTGSKLVLGSATPLVTSTYLADNSKFILSRINIRHNSVLPNVELVDKSTFQGNLSPQLSEKITSSLIKNKQTLLFLNRRGSASSLMCESCGLSVHCPNCEISLSFHGDIARLMCHYCGYTALPPTNCQDCKGELKFIGTGTQKLTEEISKLWPQARVARLDRDNATWEVMQKLYTDLNSGEVDIVIGTQMLSRGLDIESLAVVGIIDADINLSVPDYTSSERTFQLISQTAGRAGRRQDVGEVVVQTRNPTHYAIAAASRHDYDSFYAGELSHRAKFAYPPYVYLLKLWYGHKNAEQASASAAEMATELKKIPGVVVLGPAPSRQLRIHQRYVWQIIIKSKDRPRLVEIGTKLPAGWQFECDPISLL